MDAILNILVIGFAGLIAYWWANQGLFSSILHLMCVICAGVLAFATWEPATEIFAGAGSLLPYAKGIGLLLPFAVYLFVLRLLADKLAPDNLNFPHWANLSLGGAFGAASGVLTVGIAVIGIGYTHSSRDILGVVGSARSTSTRGQPKLDSTALWVPMHLVAGEFFATLSRGSFAPTLSRPTLASEYPMMAQQALGLHRDTYSKAGRLARTSASAGAIRIDRAMLANDVALPDNRTISAYLIDVHFDSGATTEGQGFAISASQLRLVGNATGKTGAGSGIAYPIAWAQPNTAGGRAVFMFDDLGHFISGPPGTQTLDATLIYPADAFPTNAPPRFLSAMGLRLPFPKVDQQSTGAAAMAMIMGGDAGGGAVKAPAGTMTINPEDLAVNDSIMPANADLNNLGAMDVKDGNYLFQGIGEYEQGGFRGNKGVIVKGIWAPPNTRVIRLNIARGGASSIDMWNDRSKVRETAGDEANLMLVDDLGRTYFPIGYLHATATGDRRVTIALQRDGAYYQIGKFPNLSSSGSDKLYAIFTPAIGRTIVGIKLGNEWVATANLLVPNPS